MGISIDSIWSQAQRLSAICFCFANQRSTKCSSIAAQMASPQNRPVFGRQSAIA